MQFGRSPAIPIPGLEPKDDVPPPLPPPRVLPFGDAPRQLSADTNKDHHHRTRAHGSSLASGYCSMGSPYADDRPQLKKRDTGGTTAGADEGYASYASTERYLDLPVHIISCLLMLTSQVSRLAARRHGPAPLQVLLPDTCRPSH